MIKKHRHRHRNYQVDPHQRRTASGSRRKGQVARFLLFRIDVRPVEIIENIVKLVRFQK